MKRHLITISFLVVMAVFLSGCEVVFTHAPAGITKEDKAILGRWISTDKEDSQGWVQIDGGPRGQMNVSFRSDDPDEKNPKFTATVLTIGVHSYLVLNPTNGDRDETFLIARYEIHGDELTVWMPDSEKFKALIQRKKIAGEGRPSGATVTDSSANVSRILASKDGEDAFEVFGKFRRVKS